MKKLLSLAAGAAGLAALALGASACNPVTPYAAVVNGTTISASVLNNELVGVQRELSLIGQSTQGFIGQGVGTYSTQAAAQVLSREIDFVVVDQELARRHIRISTSDLAAARADIPQSGQFPPGVLEKLPRAYQDVLIRRQAEITALAAAIAGADITPAGIARYAESHRISLQAVCAEQIVVNDLVSAATVENDLKAGKSFAAEAQARSQDQNTSSSGGQLGCHPALLYSQLGAEVETAVETLPLGQPSAPVKGNQGLVILEVTSRTPLSPSDAAVAIRQQLTGNAQNQVGSVIEPIVARADVTLDSRYGHWVRSGANGPEVVPPAAPKVRNG